MQTEQTTVKIIQVDGAVAIGVSVDDGCQYVVTKLIRIPQVKLGDYVLGYILHDENDDSFYLEAIEVDTDPDCN